jgi:hypothetical protein
MASGLEGTARAFVASGEAGLGAAALSLGLAVTAPSFNDLGPGVVGVVDVAGIWLGLEVAVMSSSDLVAGATAAGAAEVRGLATAALSSSGLVADDADDGLGLAIAALSLADLGVALAGAAVALLWLRPVLALAGVAERYDGALGALPVMAFGALFAVGADSGLPAALEGAVAFEGAAALGVVPELKGVAALGVVPELEGVAALGGVVPELEGVAALGGVAATGFVRAAGFALSAGLGAGFTLGAGVLPRLPFAITSERFALDFDPGCAVISLGGASLLAGCASPNFSTDGLSAADAGGV